MTWTVGVDFGGTNIKVGLVTTRGRTLASTVLSTRAHRTPRAFVEGVAGAIEQLAARTRQLRRRLVGVGVGAPGLIDASRGVIHRLVNVPGGWRGVPLRRMLRERLRCRCAVDNDANVVALGEWRFGAGRGTRQSVYVTLGTGVGGGLVIDGRLIRGHTGAAGEIGHMSLARNGPRCACGSRGCLEAFVGTAAILRKARRALRQRDGVLGRIVRDSGGHVTPELISRAARAGDRAARRIWEELGADLGVGLANVVNLLSPERIVIGGGVSKAWPWFAPSLMASLQAQAFRVPARAVRVVRAQLGDVAGVVGGAVLVWEQGASA